MTRTETFMAQLDREMAISRRVLAKVPEGKADWNLLVGGNVVMTSPRRVVIEDALTHLAHHRGQLTVYLRLNDAPVPSVYGPSADEQQF